MHARQFERQIEKNYLLSKLNNFKSEAEIYTLWDGNDFQDLIQLYTPEEIKFSGSSPVVVNLFFFAF